jgi:molybdenum cofactor cytidylyltransferase
VAAVILAAGTSSRLGRPKQLLVFRGRPLLQHVVDSAYEAGVDEIVVVLGHAASEVESMLALPTNARVCINPLFAHGQSTSLHAGIDLLSDDIDAALVLLGDQPGVSADIVRAVATAAPASITRARYSGSPGHPVRFAREVWPALNETRGDTGARDLLMSGVYNVVYVDIEGDPPPDVDTWDDYTRLSE